MQNGRGPLKKVSVLLLVTNHPFWTSFPDVMLVPRCRCVGCMALPNEGYLFPPWQLGDVCSLLWGSPSMTYFSPEGFPLVIHNILFKAYDQHYFVSFFHSLCPVLLSSSSCEQIAGLLQTPSTRSSSLYLSNISKFLWEDTPLSTD